MLYGIASRWLACRKMDNTMTPIKVFVSYSHDDDEHKARVLELANTLRSEEGIDVELDQYHLNQLWPIWCETQIRESCFVLMICTPTYKERIENPKSNPKEPKKGLGVCWEAGYIYQDIYDENGQNNKYLPILLDEGDREKNIPKRVSGYSCYRLQRPYEQCAGFKDLLNRLRGINPTPKPPLGRLSQGDPASRNLKRETSADVQPDLRAVSVQVDTKLSPPAPSGHPLPQAGEGNEGTGLNQKWFKARYVRWGFAIGSAFAVVLALGYLWDSDVEDTKGNSEQPPIVRTEPVKAFDAPRRTTTEPVKAFGTPWRTTQGFPKEPVVQPKPPAPLIAPPSTPIAQASAQADIAVKPEKTATQQKPSTQAQEAEVNEAKNLIRIKINGVYGYINAKGKFMIPPQFYEANNFAANGFASVNLNGKWGYINAKGEWEILPRFYQAENFAANGLAVVNENGKWGYIDTNGVMVIQPKFKLARSFAANGLAPVMENYEFGYIDVKGEMVISTRFMNAYSFAANGLARVMGGNGRFGYIDTKGEWVIQPRFDNAGDFAANGLAAVWENGKWGYIKAEDKWAISPRFDEAVNFAANGLAAVRENRAWGYIDANGNWVISPRFYWADKFAANGLAEVNKNGKQSFINKEGQIVVFIDQVFGSEFLKNADGSPAR